MDLLPCIVQDARTGEVLTLAYMNDEALERTRETGEMWFWSRSREELWHKGETSGNVQKLKELRLDCDEDAILALVEPDTYTGRLLADRQLVAAKVEEEAEEVARAARDESDQRVSEEAADVLYHLAVLMAERGLGLTDAYRVLNERRRG